MPREPSFARIRCVVSQCSGLAAPSTRRVQSTSLPAVNSLRASEPNTTSVVSCGTAAVR